MQAERTVGRWVYLDPQSMSNNGLQTYVHSSWAGILTAFEVGIKVSGFRSYRLRVWIRIGVYVLGPPRVRNQGVNVYRESGSRLRAKGLELIAWARGFSLPKVVLLGLVKVLPRTCRNQRLGRTFGQKTFCWFRVCWVAVKDLKYSYYIGENPMIYYIYPLW